jgi:hypothetical protein
MRCLIVIVLLSIASTSQIKSGPKTTAPASIFHDAALTAYDSLRTLDLNVDASEVGFQTRQVEAEKSLAIAGHKSVTDEEKQQFKILDMWNRLIARHRELLMNGDKEGTPMVHGIWLAQFTCHAQADLIFAPDKLTDTGKTIAKTMHCVETGQTALTQSH